MSWRQLPRDQGPSLTEIKLNELKQKQMAIQAELPERGIQVWEETRNTITTPPHCSLRHRPCAAFCSYWLYLWSSQVILPGTVVPSAPVVTLPDTEDAAPGDMAQVRSVYDLFHSSTHTAYEEQPSTIHMPRQGQRHDVRGTSCACHPSGGQEPGSQDGHEEEGGGRALPDQGTEVGRSLIRFAIML